MTWYQDLEVCKQVDNRDTAYDLEMLRGKNGSEELWDLIEFYERLLCEHTIRFLFFDDIITINTLNGDIKFMDGSKNVTVTLGDK